MEQPWEQEDHDANDDEDEYREMEQAEALSLEQHKLDLARQLKIQDEQDQQEMEMMRKIAQESKKQARKEAVERKRRLELESAERDAMRQSVEDERKRQELQAQARQQNELQLRAALAYSNNESHASSPGRRVSVRTGPSSASASHTASANRSRNDLSARRQNKPAATSVTMSVANGGPQSRAISSRPMQHEHGTRLKTPSEPPPRYVTEEQDAAAKAAHATKWQAFSDAWPNNKAFSEQELPGYEMEAPIGHASIEMPREDGS